MAALRSPFYGENLNLILLRQKIEALDYTPLPTNFYSAEVCFGVIYIYFTYLLFLASSSCLKMSCHRS